MPYARKRRRTMAPRRRASTGRFRGYYRKVGNYGRYNRPGAGRQEQKFFDSDWDQAVANNIAGRVQVPGSAVLIGQGLTESTRIGRKAVIRSILWRGHVQLQASAANIVSDTQTCRILIILDTQCNGVTADPSDTNGLLQTGHYLSFNNLVNKGRFRVLYDKFVEFTPVAAAGDGTTNDTGGVGRFLSFSKKNCNIPIEYSGVANPAVISEIRTNNIFGMLVNRTGASDIVLDSRFRFRFTDG